LVDVKTHELRRRAAAGGASSGRGHPQAGARLHPGNNLRDAASMFVSQRSSNMATENHGIPRLRSRRLFGGADGGEELTVTGTVVTRLHQHSPRIPESNVHAVRAHLERVLRSPHFDGSTRSREFLRYVVEEVLAGRGAYLKQAAIAVEVFGRKPDFDAVIDPIVRVQAGRLRRSLERYYLLSGDVDTLRIELPKGSYAPVFAEISDMPAQTNARGSQAQDWPTVSVFPVSSQCERDAGPAAQLREELTAELCRYGIVRVSRQRDPLGVPGSAGAARFELHGFALDARAFPAFGARLVDCATGQQIWADEFHTEPRPGCWSGNAAEIGRVIAARIGSEHGVIARLLAGELAARGFPPGDNFTAIARCQHFMFSHQVGALPPAIESLQQLTGRAPEIELAWTSLARLYLMNHSFELSSMFTPVEMAIGAANQSVLLEPASARTRCLMATALLVKGELAAARREIEHALRLNSDSLAHREVIGWLLALTGDWDHGVALMRDAMARNPFCQPCVSHGLWADAMRRHDFDAAYAAALEYRDPNFFWRELMLTSTLGHLGRLEEAADSAAELLRARPQFQHRGRRLIAHYIRADDLRATIVEGLHKSGMAVA
jgi:adenylate cyclase